MKSIDILVAVRNEEKSVNEFVERMNELAPNNVNINFMFLEDGSSDRTVELLKNLSKNYNNINYISFENKYGQYAALTYGLTVSRADAVITMDVDGGHPIETAIEMIKSYLEGNNIVQGHRIVYYMIVGVNFFKQNVMFRLMDKSTKQKFLQHKNWWHIFKTNFRTDDGVKEIYIEYSAPEREFGESKYNFIRLLKLSYKSFFALLSLKRFIVIDLILIALIYFFSSYVFIVLSILITMLFLLLNISYYVIVNHYPITELKIIETSITGLKR